MTALHTAAAWLALAVLVGGCAAGGSTAAPHQDPARPEVGHPFGNAVHFSAEERAVTTAAEEELVGGCMRRRGFGYVPRKAGPDGRGDVANPYGLLTVDVARAHGYGMVEAAANPPAADDPNEQARRALSAPRRAAWDAALLGTDRHRKKIEVDGHTLTLNSDSCVHTARAELYGTGWERLYLTAQIVSNRVIVGVSRSAAVVGAEQRWSACMRRLGHEVRTLLDARQRVDRALTTTPDAARIAAAAGLEQDIATDDATCQQESGLRDAVEAAQAAEERRQPEAARAVVRQLDLARTRAVANARAILRD